MTHFNNSVGNILTFSYTGYGLRVMVKHLVQPASLFTKQIHREAGFLCGAYYLLFLRTETVAAGCTDGFALPTV